MRQNFELWVSVFVDDNDPSPENVASLTRRNPNECINQLWNSVPYCDRGFCGSNDVQPTLIRADGKRRITQIEFRPFLATALVYISFEAQERKCRPANFMS